ncbi:hypothetical protein BKA70DRAFT_1272495 [Coprinopsis sp. MPI-PUGE-AT-0042]|nr:hypothetical protein BKA70DRAFT_1272495 [Coprinopsis sp. MPI-PUGE-AT-0042]
MSTVDSDCIVCCCPCITVWAGFYFAYRGIADGSVFCYNKARQACSTKGFEDEKEVASALDHGPPPSISTLQYWGSQTSHKDLAVTRTSTSTHPYPSVVGQPHVVQLPPKAVPSMRVTPMGGGSDCGGSEIERSYYPRRGSFYAGSTYSRKTNEDGYEGASSVSDFHGTHHDKKQQECTGGCANRTVLERVPESPIPPRTATSDGKS